MALGRRLHELCRLRFGLAVSVVLALLAGVWSVADVSVRLTPRQLTTSAAKTSALVEGRRSIVLDARTATGDFPAITGRALLIANVMASVEARRNIAKFAGVPEAAIAITSPVTPVAPRPLDRPGQAGSTSDIFKSPNEYRLSLHSNPTVPMIDVYATAPSPGAATRLANAAVAGMQSWLLKRANSEHVPLAQRVHLRQLGRAEGAEVDGGVDIHLALLAFLVVLATSCTAVVFLGRLRSGWKVRPAPGVPVAAGHES